MHMHRKSKVTKSYMNANPRREGDPLMSLGAKCTAPD